MFELAVTNVSNSGFLFFLGVQELFALNGLICVEGFESVELSVSESLSFCSEKKSISRSLL